MENETVQENVIAARKGDTQAFGRLYESFYSTLVWLAYAILLDRNLAEDAAQQAFVKACEKLGSLQQVNRFGPWLSRICRNEAYQLLRDRQRRESRETAAPEPVTMVDTRDTEEDLDQVKAAVDRLPEMYREIVVLHYYQRLDYRKIASLLGVAGHTVRGRLFRARKMVMKSLQDNGYAGGQQQ